MLAEFATIPALVLASPIPPDIPAENSLTASEPAAFALDMILRKPPSTPFETAEPELEPSLIPSLIFPR